MNTCDIRAIQYRISIIEKEIDEINNYLDSLLTTTTTTGIDTSGTTRYYDDTVTHDYTYNN